MKPHPLHRLVTEHTAPKHCCTRDVHDMLAPIHATITRAQRQIIEYRATTAPDYLTDDQCPGKYEHIDQILRRVEQDAAAVLEAARELAKDFMQLDRYLAEAKADTRVDADKPPAA